MAVARSKSACIFAAMMATTTLLAGCASLQYRFGGKAYSTEAEMISAVQEFVDSNLEQIVPVQGPVGGQAVVILASKKRFLEKAVLPAEQAWTLDAETADLWAETRFMGHAMMGDAIERAQLFNHFNIVSSDDPATTAPITGGHYVIWYDLRNPDSAQWYARNNVDGAVMEVPIDMGEKIGAPRIQKWLQSLNDALVRSKSRATRSRRAQG